MARKSSPSPRNSKRSVTKKNRPRLRAEKNAPASAGAFSFGKFGIRNFHRRRAHRSPRWTQIHRTIAKQRKDAKSSHGQLTQRRGGAEIFIWTRKSQGQRQRAGSSDGGSLRRKRPDWLVQKVQSGRWIEQTPSHGTYFIEGVHRFSCPASTDRPSVCEERQVGVDLFGRGVGDSPVVRPVSSKPAVAFSEVGRDRAC